MNSEKRWPDLVVVSGTWPVDSTGYGIAVRSALRVYARRFRRIHFFGPRSESFDGQCEWSEAEFRWIPLSFVRGPMWFRFLKSLASRDPAITVRYRAAAEAFLESLQEVLSSNPERERPVVIIYEDVPAACLLPAVSRSFPSALQAIRSHNTLVRGFADLDRRGSPIARLAWRLELSKIGAFEKRVCELADALWAITPVDASAYVEALGITPDGLIGIAMPGEQYSEVSEGDPRTVVHVGSADLRKGKGLRDFIRVAWPKIRSCYPDAALVLGGRGTEQYSNPDVGIEGLGFVRDDREVLGRGRVFINPQEIGAGIQLKSVVAMLAGRAMVSTNVGVQGVEGRDQEDFVVAQSIRGMADEITKLMGNETEMRRIGMSARRTAAEHYGESRLFEEAGLAVDSLLRRAERR